MGDGDVVWLGSVGNRKEAIEALWFLSECTGLQYFAFDLSTRRKAPKARLQTNDQNLAVRKPTPGFRTRAAVRWPHNGRRPLLQGGEPA